MITYYSIIWFAFSTLAGFVAGYYAFINVKEFTMIVDLLTTIVSVFAGLSFVIVGVLMNPLSVDEKNATTKREAKRKLNFIKKIEKNVMMNQSLRFIFYYITLFSAMVFKWVVASDTPNLDSMSVKILSASTAGLGIFIFVWSANLIRTLQNISNVRNYSRL